MQISIQGKHASIGVSSPEEALKLISLLGIQDIKVNMESTQARVEKQERVVLRRKSHKISHWTQEEVDFILANLSKGIPALTRCNELRARHSAGSIAGYAKLIQTNSNHLPQTIRKMIRTHAPTNILKAAQPGFSTNNIAPTYERMTEDRAS